MTRSLLAAGLLLVLGDFTLGQPWRKRPDVPAVEPDGIKLTIFVSVPSEKARIWIDGKLTTQTGTERVFYTPPLAPGKYQYYLLAKWTENEIMVTAERTLRFRPEKMRKHELSVKFKADSLPKKVP